MSSTSGARSEAPTPRRLREARRQGQVARSRELSGAAALAGAMVAVAVAGPSVVNRLVSRLGRSLVAACAGADPLSATWEWLVTLSTALLPCCGIALLTGCSVAMIQTGGIHFHTPAVAIDLGRLHPIKGFRRLFSAAQLGGIGLGLAKVLAGGTIAWHWLFTTGAPLTRLPLLPPWLSVAAISGLFLPLALQLYALHAIAGFLDFCWVRRCHLRALRMTREEVRRDLREQEGDPLYRAERQRRHRALAAARPLAEATCVVVNPLHVAIALWHRRGSEDAPVVLAKGRGLTAVRIRSQARRAGVPLVRDVTLARALYRLVEVGEEIPEELYQAAALVLIHVYGAASREEGA